MEEIFGPEGLIAQSHPDYEHRPGQIQMARAVMRAFEENRHLIVEAGTGTGKTLAYLVPAVAAALGGRGRVIVSTGTKNLQEQLMEKDIPFLQNILPRNFSATYMLSALLGIGSGVVKVLAMDRAMRLPFKVSTTTSNFMWRKCSVKS